MSIPLVDLIIGNGNGKFEMEDRMVRFNGNGYSKDRRSTIIKKGISNNGVMEVFVCLFVCLFIYLFI
jgi:hypothetical protein